MVIQYSKIILCDEPDFHCPRGVSIIQSSFDFLTDLQNAFAHLGRFAGFETNS